MVIFNTLLQGVVPCICPMFHELTSLLSFAMNIGPALMTVWSKVPPLTARCLSLMPEFESRPGHVRKLPVTWGCGFCRVLRFPPLQSKPVLRDHPREDQNMVS